ncbi:DnaD domain protein [Limosilactobacillus sp. RRLNB_1_1]|uniref:DnaD domain protein n=1 Tax=Limosilactobacillus albertensis TaxID=2759752 RepID=A0A7W3TRY2_9LACO|nr:DnaD domain protein [Limosilactobacillus albertensis]MBB1069765.1 DnaD domain protein [Limosilactobacillus albertensis]MBB1122955.1 DnaD domain protein [Limosilactobacillus albertensis]MCD7117643.1 DnaD domain protein [Limosilactobacillus albertensis]MCD7122478.1 DnaD domain protein [Limosilactobacillus albertensis]MCD7129566.1 DnaD domain protein [Limosilactobacillus albertensis]
MADTDLLQHYLQAGETNISNLLLHHYKELGMTTSQFVLYLQFKSYQDRGIMNPDVRTIAKNLGTEERQVFEQLHQMMTNHLVEQKMRKLDNGKEDAIYDFSLLINKLALLNENDKELSIKVENTATRAETFNQLEAEFGRPLSSMELQIVNDWLDKDNYSAVMIKLALRQAVMNSALNLQYMDRILQSWNRQGLRTERDIGEHEKRFEQRKASGQKAIKKTLGKPKIPIYKLGE